MITAVDTSVLLDVLVADPSFGPQSRIALRSCQDQGRLIACDVVWAEVAGYFRSEQAARDAMKDLGVEFSETSWEAALLAGMVWKAYRKHGGQRKRIAPDFLIGAHALAQAERLLTRDRGFYRTYFSRLSILDPTHV